MLNETIGIYAIIDDLLKAIAHQEDCRTEMSDAEIITTAIIAAMFFDGNHSKACSYMKDHKLIPYMLEKSRFNRRLHRVSMLINDLFHHWTLDKKKLVREYHSRTKKLGIINYPSYFSLLSETELNP
jgi:hypothetical protein